MVNGKGVVGQLSVAEAEVVRLRGLLSAAKARVEMTERFRQVAVDGNSLEARAEAALNAFVALNGRNELQGQLNRAESAAHSASLRWEIAVASCG